MPEAIDPFPEKAPYGHPCNGCGLCCQNEVCPLGQIVFPRAQAPCPALERNGERYVCGLVRHPEAYQPAKTALYGADALRKAAEIGVGADIGCDAKMRGEATHPPRDFILAMLRLASMPRSTSRRIEKLWSWPNV